MARAQSLKQETALNSITPERAGGIMYDTAALLNQQQLQGTNPLLISKIYASIDAMEADDSPVSDISGEALKPGQIVVISSAQPDEPDEGLVYRFNGIVEEASSWTCVGKIGSDPYLEGYQYMGKAVLTPTPTDPGVPTQKVFYQATEPGTYTNFAGIVVADGEVVNLKWDGTAWNKERTGLATYEELRVLEDKASDVVPVHLGGGVVDGRIVYDADRKNLKIAADTQTRELTLDDIAYENLTYRQIFETNNALGISPGFENGSFAPMVAANGSPAITGDVADSGEYCLKCFGAVSTQISSASPWGSDYKQSMYVAMRVSCVRYSAGKLGFSLTGISLAKQAVTEGFETISTLSTPTYGVSSSPFVGSFSSANLDGYIDTPVVVLMGLFVSAPTKAQMDEMYETYVLIKQGNAPTIVVGATEIGIQLKDTRTFTDSDCKAAFVAEMNKTAQRIGAVSSNFPDASGLVSENSYTTAQDLFRILVHAAGVDKIAEKWGKKEHTFDVYGVNARQEEITTSVQNPTYYDDDKNPILGGKTGTLSLISPATYNLMFVTTVDVAGHLSARTLGGVDVTKPVNLAIAFLGSNSDANRWQDAQKLVTFLEGILNGEDVPSPAPNALYVAAGFLPDRPITYDGYPFKFLYSKNSTTAGVPASCTKIISLITLYENIYDENEVVEIKASDLIGGSGNNLQAGDLVRIKDLVYDMLLPSSNDAATALSRIVGEKILRSRPAETPQP